MEKTDRHRVTQVIATIVLGLATLRYGLTSIATYDVWWHLLTGEQILATRTLLPTDPFSHTFYGKPWPFKDWLADVVLAWLHSRAGNAALVLLTCVAVIVTVAAVAWTVRRARGCDGWVVLAVTALFLGAVGFRFSERPATLAFALTAVALAVLEAARAEVRRNGRMPRWVWWVVPLTALMANLHRGSLAVAALVAMFCGAEAAAAFRTRRDGPAQARAGAAWWTLLLLLLATTLASVASPAGWSAVTQAFDVMAVSDLRRDMPEWEALTWGTVVEATPASLLLLVLVLLGLRGVPALWDALLVLLGIALAAAGVRFFPYFGLLVAPVAATALQRASASWRPFTRSVVAVCASVGVLAAVWLSDRPHVGLGLQRDRYPTAALQFVRERLAAGELRGEMFNEYHHGGFLLFHLWPERRVYIDGRSNQVYDVAFINRYRRALVDGDELLREARRRGITWLFLDNWPWDAARAAAIDRHWTLIFASGRGLVYVDRAPGGPNAVLAQRLGYRFLRPHDLFQSIQDAWQQPADRARVLAEARRMIAEDASSLPAHMALAYVLDLLGPEADAELQHVTERLLELGWDPSLSR